MPRQITELPKPAVHLSTGVNGNVYAIIGVCKRAAKQGGWTNDEWDVFEEDLLHKSEDYDHVLQKILRAFEVS